MATARIDADRVGEAAKAKIAAIDEIVAAGRLADIIDIQKEVRKSGALWRRRLSVFSAAEAEVEYDRRLTCGVRTHVWWRHMDRSAGLGLAGKLADLAASSSDGYVTLDHDEARFLGLPVAA